MPGWIQQKMLSILDTVPKWFLYAPVGLVVAALIAFSGRGELQLRSYGLVVVGIWLMVDLWNWLLRKQTLWKFVIGWTCTNLLLILVMAIMWWWLDGKLADQRDDAQQNLSLSVAGQAIDSEFTVRNNSKTDIGPNQIYCGINRLVTSAHNEILGSLSHYGPSTDHLLAGGDARSEPCLKPVDTFLNNPTLICADITVSFYFELETQPGRKMWKSARFVDEIPHDGYEWHSEPIDAKVQYCEPYH